MSAILVTGCAGFIGSTLVERLLQAGERVIGIDCLTDYYARALKERNLRTFRNHPNFIFFPTTVQTQIQGHFLDVDRSGRQKITHVIHLAAYPGVQYSFVRPDLYVEHNINGTVAALEIARQNGAKMVFASSSSVYGDCPTRPFVESEKPSPISVYGATKLSGEQFCEMYHRVYGVEAYCLRIFTCYGPKQRPDLAIRKFAQELAYGLKIELRGDGSTSRDYTYVTDIVEGIIKAKDRVSGFDVINLGNNRPISLEQLVTTLQEALEVKNPNIVRVGIPTGDVLHTCANIDKAKQLLDWQPQVDFQTGIQYFLNWFKDNL